MLFRSVVLVVAISTSPKTSKTESGCKSYVRFRTGGFAVFPSSGSTGAGTAGNPFCKGVAVVPVKPPVVPLPGTVFQPVGVLNHPGGGSTGAGTAGNPFGLYLAVVPVVSPVVPLPGSVFQPVWCSNSPGGR